MTDRKHAIATRLLNNSVYMPESGMRKDLTEALAKLSLVSLTNLELLMQIKIDDAVKAKESKAASGVAAVIRGRKFVATSKG